MPLTYRFNTVQKVLGSYLAPNASVSVTVYEPGAIASGASTDTTVPVHAGHGFAANDKLVVGTNLTTYRQVSSVTATELTVDSAVTVADGDVIVNLGSDTGGSAPNWDGSGLTIYSDPTGSTAVTNETVTPNSQGEYNYYHRGLELWEVIRSGSTILDVVRDIPQPADQTVRWAHEYATGGDGTGSSPWTGWETAVSGAPVGTEIRFATGWFELATGGVTVPNGCALVGANRGSRNSIENTGTIIRCADGFTGAMFTTDTDSFGTRFENLLIDGSFGSNTAIATNGIVIDGCTRAQVYNCDLRLFLGSAVKVTKSAGSTNPGTFRILGCYITGAVQGTSLSDYTGALHFTHGSEPFIENCYFGCSNSTYTYTESGKQCAIAFMPASAGDTGGFTMLNCNFEYAETGVYIKTGTGGGWNMIGCQGGPIAGHGIYNDAGGRLIGCVITNAGANATNTYDSFYIGSNASYNQYIGCYARWTTGNKHRYGFNDNGGASGVNHFIACISDAALTAPYNNSHAVTKQSVWIGDRLVSGNFRFVIGTGHAGLGRGVDENIEFAFDGSTDDGTISYRADQGAGVSRRFIVDKNLEATTLHAAGDSGGIASRNSFTNVSDVTANSTGVGTILFKGATNRDSTGFIKIYIGTTAYYIPVFSAITG